MGDLIWAKAAADSDIGERVAAVVSRPGRKTLAVPGGRTPIPILEALGGRALDWSEAEITLTDDRLVPPDHPASNFGLLSRTLGGTGARLTPLSEGMAVPHFDLVWLGMGTDGHIASLFPSVPETRDRERGVIRLTPDPLPPEAPFDRLSLTMASLLDADDIILVVRGEDKRAVLEAAAERRSDTPVARLIAGARGPVTVFWS